MFWECLFLILKVINNHCKNANAIILVLRLEVLGGISTHSISPHFTPYVQAPLTPFSLTPQYSFSRLYPGIPLTSFSTVVQLSDMDIKDSDITDRLHELTQLQHRSG